MKKLYRGIHHFQQSYFEKEEDFFKRLSVTQNPEVLFITCADSRVDPNLVTQSKPGELFIVRNLGNIIPPFNAIKDKNSIGAAIEFAVMRLKVSDLIVCGHSNCGAIKALCDGEEALADTPHLRDWLRIAGPVTEIVRSYYGESPPELCQQLTEQENILEQLRNIQTYPFVIQALNNGTLHLHGWYYEIGTGEIYSYNPGKEVFEKIVYVEKKSS